MFCPGCGNAVTSGGRFCFNCGAALPVTQATAVAGNGHDEATVGSRAEHENRAARGGDALAGRVIEGKYRLEERIGVGGMGTVYRATRLLIGDTVAVKLMHAEFMRDTEAERFRREAQAAARLKHPNAVSVYDFGLTPDGTLYLVMELVEGESLRQLIKRQGRLDLKAACEIVRQVCAALDEAHHRHIVHRDIKPDNIIVHTTAKGARVKVLDFGVAKLRDVPTTTLTQTGSVVGTPHYMSPEQCLGEELDHRSDIYSVGVVLYEMLCGVVPFNAPISTAVIVQHVNQPPPPPREKNGAVTPALERAVLRALEKNREARPQTAGALAEEVEAAFMGRVWSEEVRWESAGAEVATVDSERQRATLDDEEPTAANARGGQPPRQAGASGSGSQFAPTAVMRTPPSVSGSANPVGLYAGGGQSVVAPARRTPRVVALAAAALLALFGVVGLGVWLSQGGAGGGERAAKNTNGGAQGKSSPGQGGTKADAANAAGGARAERGSTPRPPPGMAYVPGGVFTMGSNVGDSYERPAHKVTLQPFFIDKYEVTCGDYAHFLGETNHPRLPLGWRAPSCPPGAERLPVRGVTWDDANAYARWVGKRLPTEEEWECAARGTDGRKYPWGDDWRAGLANADGRSSVAEVGQFGGASPAGAFDMTGNVWEWTASPLVAYPGGGALGLPPGDYRVIRGGAWNTPKEHAATTYRGYLARDSGDTDKTGFRCAREVAQ